MQKGTTSFLQRASVLPLPPASMELRSLQGGTERLEASSFPDAKEFTKKINAVLTNIGLSVVENLLCLL